MKNVFLVRTPFHYLGIIEALHHFDCKPEESVILVQARTPERLNIYKEMGRDFNWGDIIGIEPPLSKKQSKSRNALFYNYALIQSYNKVAKGFSHVKYFFSPLLHRKEVSHFCKLMQPEHTVLTDEGISMPIILNMLRQRKGKKTSGGILSMLENTMLKYDRAIVQPDAIVSAFNLDGFDEYPIVKHKFEGLKTRYDSLEDKKISYKALILGSPYERVAESPEEYTRLVYKMVSALQGNDISVLYAPHRLENRAEVENIANTLQLEIYNNNGFPIEYTLLKEKVIPAKIACFGSSVLETLRLIFEDEIEKIVVMLEKQSNFRNEGMEKVNDYARTIKDDRIIYLN